MILRSRIIFESALILASLVPWSDAAQGKKVGAQILKLVRLFLETPTRELPADRIKQALQKAWQANSPADPLPGQEISSLVKSRYSLTDWNLRN